MSDSNTAASNVNNSVNKQYNLKEIFSLLDDEHPIVIKPKLAVLIGLNEAIVLQQMKYWLKKSKHIINNKKWIWNTYSDWKEQLPFFSDKTIRRTIDNLEKKGLLESGFHHNDPRNRTKWYALVGLEIGANASGQNDHMELVNLTTCSTDTETTYTETTNNIHTSALSADIARSSSSDIEEIFNYWKTTLNHPRAALTADRKKCITKTLKSYSVSDLKKAIDGCKNSPFNMGENDRGQVYDDICLILRTSGHIDRFIFNADHKPTPKPKTFQEREMKAIETHMEGFHELADRINAKKGKGNDSLLKR